MPRIIDNAYIKVNIVVRTNKVGNYYCSIVYK